MLSLLDGGLDLPNLSLAGAAAVGDAFAGAAGVGLGRVEAGEAQVGGMEGEFCCGKCTLVWCVGRFWRGMLAGWAGVSLVWETG